LIWLVGDEIRDALFGSDERSPYPLREMDTWSYLAPLGNLLAGWWLMSELQHERFVSGLTKEFAPLPPVVDGGKERHQYVGKVNLAPYIAPGHFLDFIGFKDVRAVVTPRILQLSADGEAAHATVEVVRAIVRHGGLEIVVSVLGDVPAAPPGPALLDQLEVAWIVDTSKPEPSE